MWRQHWRCREWHCRTTTPTTRTDNMIPLCLHAGITKYFSYSSTKNIYCWYSLEVLQWGYSNEYLNICFRGEIRKISTLLDWKIQKAPSLELWDNADLTLVLLNLDILFLCKQYRSRSVGFFRSQLIWICTICRYICEFITTIWFK